jgi:hypothetical protein
MRFYMTQHKFYCGIDLHVDWMYFCVIDADGEVRVHKNIRTNPKAFLQALQPLGRIAKPQNCRGLLERFDHRCVQKTMAMDLALIDCDDPLRADLECSIEKTAQSHDAVSLALLRTISGVGKILALVTLYESEGVARFPRVNAFVSYAAWSKAPRRRMVNATAPAARRSATRTSSGPSRKRRCSFSRITSRPKSTWHSSPPDTARARRCRSSPTNWGGRSISCSSISSHATRKSSWPQRRGGSGLVWRLTRAIGARGTQPAHRAERSCSWDMSPNQRRLCRTSIPASWRVDWRSVPRLDLAATCSHA